MSPRLSPSVAVGAAALAQQLSAVRAGGGLEHLFVQHGSGACSMEGSHALRTHVGFSGRRFCASVDGCCSVLTMGKSNEGLRPRRALLTRRQFYGTFCHGRCPGTQTSHFDSDVCFQVQHSPAASIFMTAVLAGENISWAHISWGKRRTGMAVANQDETARRAGKLDGQEVTSTTLYIDDSLQPSNGGRRIGATKDYTAVARFAAATTAATGPVRDGDARRRCEGAR